MRCLRETMRTPLEQRMADLPADRIEATPPFTNIGFDVFGPWSIQTRRTRGRTTNLKSWGLVFTCLRSRTIRIETLESMDTSSFICALRCFSALRGPALLLRCDSRHQFRGREVRTGQRHEGDGPAQIGEVCQRPGLGVAFQRTSRFELWGCLGATDWDYLPCVKRHVFGAWGIPTHTRTSCNTDGRSYGDR